MKNKSKIDSLVAVEQLAMKKKKKKKKKKVPRKPRYILLKLY
eukprot:CAMPEP_0114397290 /NCGR_PEP_ID=MMETSP0102-20121206/14159_1 /TAXON_ID=38822 ORGANISM="Pteridomonas danica, Strain PT" /NCGR_SAMPLE_ID=MMETSP0102 /ASSEMBLY_ACC=CAM_ASM_000212 /LENGTH=41 /DNA_ID= /DNA_START= /DNA_END= /DNA_ORIENTATION=